METPFSLTAAAAGDEVQTIKSPTQRRRYILDLLQAPPKAAAAAAAAPTTPFTPPGQVQPLRWSLPPSPLSSPEWHEDLPESSLASAREPLECNPAWLEDVLNSDDEY